MFSAVPRFVICGDQWGELHNICPNNTCISVMTPQISHDKTLLILIAHGDRGLNSSNDILLGHVQTLQKQNLFKNVLAGVLSGSPDIDISLQEAGKGDYEKLIVFPMFMADGYFVQTVTRNKIKAASFPIPVDMLPPLGLIPELAELMLKQAVSCAIENNIEPDLSRLLVVGHGSSKSNASAEATRQATSRIQANAPFEFVEYCFLEEPPFINEVLAASNKPTIISGYFISDGLHGGDDIPKAMSGSACPTFYAGAIGAHEQIPALILKILNPHFSPE